MAPPVLPALKPHILVVDDDDRLRTLLRRYLSEQGMVVATACNAAEARHLLEELSLDLMVLDVMMPGETGIELVQSLKKNPKKIRIPVLLLTARGESEDRIQGFEAGADDYLAKPFEPRELLLRISAILRRTPPKTEKAPEIRCGKWIYDPERDELQAGEEIVRLTDMEAGLMRMLAASPGLVVSREELAGENKENVNDRTIDVQVTRLRRKIEDDAKNPRYLVTVRGEGYMLLPDRT